MNAVVELHQKGTRIERLFTSISEEITTLQKQKQDLKYNIDDLNAQLTAANVSVEHKDKVCIVPTIKYLTDDF